MSVASQSAIISIGRQAQFIGEGTAFDEAIHVPGGFYRIRAPRVNFGPIDDSQDFPMEVGGDIVPTGVFKQGVAVAGQIEMLPRTELSTAMLAYHAMGKHEVEADVDLDGTAAVGVNVHNFTLGDVSSILPWLAFRKVVQGEGAGNRIGETYFDCLLSGLEFIVPNRGKVMARVSAFGRDYVMADDAETGTWTYENYPSGGTFEDSSTVPEAGRGFMKIGGTQYPAVGVQIGMMNQLSTPDEEQVIGSFKMESIVPKARTLTIQWTYKWKDPTLWRKILNGGVAANDVWDSAPFLTSGANTAFTARFLAPKKISTTDVHYGLEVNASKVVWRAGGAPELAAGGIVLLPIVGTAIDPGNGDPYARIRVQTDADWPAS